MTQRRSTKLEIPHPNEKDCRIVGILEEGHSIEPEKKIALILHGSAGHKDYLFLKRLALRLPMDSFRFDFRGNHETPGKWNQGGMDEDIQDLNAVVDYLKTRGYRVDLIVGHSRGSLVAFRWLCTAEDARTVSGFVNASARYRMRKIYDAPFAAEWLNGFAEKGFHIWTPTVARKVVKYTVYSADLERFANYDSSLVWTKFPENTDVLTIHGLQDKTVPPYDAVIYSRALGSRTPGTHNLHLIENGDHNFTGMSDEIVDTILDWWEKRQHSGVKTGIWLTGTEAKL
ncbi:ectomycorrhiza-regulated esterase lipase thioesterase family protein [Moniliophthora roreri MCA 2997]|uniref:Ectomycorrhiza-regulated esterase lipase thioesterase family protein n=2 Tax=Moniliophthora roreri TaxID=221103 RepID=V2XS70_MONRO|nr:ectomycorrhiza-regulated esterase lipase thioesterase family protein [Moniliophthora roreri MCA 2997]KAI3621245.1 ectomycorrhiza-regulated esterase lipase thioesterase family protein [Moniliophthora roreri]